MNLIMMNGCFATMKTAVSRNLGRLLSVPVLNQNQFGKIFGPHKMACGERYQLLVADAEKRISAGSSLILDGSFQLESWRERVYEICRKYEIQNFVVVRCVCNNVELIKRRLEWRKNNPRLAKNETHSFQAYLNSVSRDEDPKKDSFKPCIVEFDSEAMKITNISAPTPFGLLIRAHLESELRKKHLAQKIKTINKRNKSPRAVRTMKKRLPKYDSNPSARFWFFWKNLVGV